jgi:hypothetical protein
MGNKSRWMAAKGNSISDSMPGTFKTRISEADSTRPSKRAVFPIPGSPLITSAALRPSLADTNNPFRRS